jgi:hypothetical protein
MQSRFWKIDDRQTDPVHPAAAHFARGDRDHQSAQRLLITERRASIQTKQHHGECRGGEQCNSQNH